jgi:hypothetical protein
VAEILPLVASAQVYFCRMYSKQDAAALRQAFWTAFGQYMSPVLSADGERINWVNYKTGEKDIRFRMEAGNKNASVSIEITHKDKELQQLYFDQFLELKNIFEATTGGDWVWRLHIQDEYGKMVSKIQVEKAGVSIFNREDWPELISFFKQQMVALDSFWSEARYSFESLR